MFMYSNHDTFHFPIVFSDWLSHVNLWICLGFFLLVCLLDCFSLQLLIYLNSYIDEQKLIKLIMLSRNTLGPDLVKYLNTN